MVSDQPTGQEIIENARSHGVMLNGYLGSYQLLGHTANGSSSVIGPTDVPWQHDFTILPIDDNA